MSLQHIFRQPDINQMAAQAAGDPSITLLDVRTDEEYREGHIPGSVHLELARAEQIGALVPDKEQKLYVYCHSGARSSSACTIFQRMGYTQVTNIGGIAFFKGDVTKE